MGCIWDKESNLAEREVTAVLALMSKWDKSARPKHATATKVSQVT